jgi:predicted deacylase
MDAYGPVSCRVEIESDGFHAGNVYLDHSDNEHAAALIPVPIIVLRNGAGPTVLLSAGVHGDEYEGQLALRGFAHRIPLDEVTGRIILLPAFNAPAVRAAARVSPLDGVNLNRAFPGAVDQGPTKALAGFVMERLVPLCNFALDLHSGGTTGIYRDLAYLSLSADPALRATTIEMAEWLGAPMTYAVPAGDCTGDFDQAVLARQVPFLSSEFGGGAVLNLTSLATARGGIRNILHMTGVWRHRTERAAPGTQYVTSDPDGLVLAPEAGLFEPACEVGSEVRRGDCAGWIYDLDEPGRAPRELSFDTSGRVMMRRAPVICQAGAILATVVRPLSRAELADLR